jgi:hypothetical protein
MFRPSLAIALTAQALLFAAGCRSQPSSGSGGDAATTTSSVSASAAAAPPAAKRPDIKALASGAGGFAVLFRDGRIVASTLRGRRTAHATGDVRNFRADSGSLFSWIEGGRPTIWDVDKDPKALCELEHVNDLVVETRRACAITIERALVCTDASTPACGALAKSTLKGPFRRFAVAKKGGSLLIDGDGATAQLTFPNDTPTPTPIQGESGTHDFLGHRVRYSEARAGGSIVGSIAESCVRSGGSFKCLDAKTGKARPMTEVPVDASRVGFVGKNAFCYVRANRMECKSVDPGIADRTGNAFVGKLLEQIPKLPDEERIIDWGALDEGVVVLTANDKVFTWTIERPARGEATAPTSWSSFEVEEKKR